MLRIGLTGGIGAGKSTVSAVFAGLGGVLVDADVLAREVVAPGTPGLAALVDRFGPRILADDGSLDRPTMGAIAFADAEARAALNGIVHPLVGRRRQEILDAVPDDAVVVEDVPLLVETGMAPHLPLVVVVGADADLRVRRLVEHRGMTVADARARIEAQASDADRRAAADVWLDNSGAVDDVREAARALWTGRIAGFATNLREGRVAQGPTTPVPPDPRWPEQAARVAARLRAACGARASAVEHVGSTADGTRDAPDVLDLRVAVPSPDAAATVRAAIVAAGYPEAPGREDVHGAADPGRPAWVHLAVGD